ncbi:MAG TPA: hypothetical protein VFN61_07880, partial [Acidimicrobiales bacterium]|nr:hypothetical protein [Acidimicrobiales bacterium]
MKLAPALVSVALALTALSGATPGSGGETPARSEVANSEDSISSRATYTGPVNLPPLTGHPAGAADR